MSTSKKVVVITGASQGIGAGVGCAATADRPALGCRCVSRGSFRLQVSPDTRALAGTFARPTPCS